jgi:hypothetical protein
MSKKLLAFLLSELKIVRIVCQNQACQTVVEMPLDVFEKGIADPLRCKFCNQEFNPTHAGTPPLAAFAAAIQALRGLKNVVDLEFVLPADE